jgi:hypothetical protein
MPIFPQRLNLSALILCLEHTIQSEKTEEVRIILQRRFSEEIVHTEGSGFFADKRQYKGIICDDKIKLHGPYGDRKWTLLTNGSIVATPNGGSILRLQMRPATWLIIVTLLTIAPVLIILSSNGGFPRGFWIFPTLFIYGAAVFGSYHEALIVTALFRNMLRNSSN